jgi:hypothetical protein
MAFFLFSLKNDFVNHCNQRAGVGITKIAEAAAAD